MERRRLLRLLAAGLAAPVLVRETAAAGPSRGPDAERLAHALSRPSAADEGVVMVVAAGIAAARRLDDVSGSRIAADPALAQRKVVHTLLEGGARERVKARLAVAAGELSQFLGWLAEDMNDIQTSRGYLDEALRIAHETGAHDLAAYVLGKRSGLETGEDRPQQGRAFAEAARSLAEARGSLATRSWLATIEAKALAKLGDRAGAERALDRARTTFDRSRAGDEPPWIYYWGEARLQYGVGTACLTLGLPEKARHAMETALSQSDPSMVRDRAWYLARLGHTYVLDAEVDEACRLAGQALTIATATRSEGAVLRVRQLRTQLQPWESEVVVRDLDDRLAATSVWCRPASV